MKSQLFLVVLVALVHSSLVLSSPPACGPTDIESVDLSELEAFRKKANSAKSESDNYFFDIIIKKAAEYIFDLRSDDKNSSHRLLQVAKKKSKEGSDYIVNAVPKAVRRECDGAVKSTIKPIYAQIDEIFEAFECAAELVRTGRNSTTSNRAAIEVYQIKAQKSTKRIIKAYTNLIPYCLNSIDADTLAVIKKIEDAAIAERLCDMNARFNAIKLLDDAVACGNKNLSLIYKIEEFRTESQTRVRNEIYYVFSLYEALYIKSYLYKCITKAATLTNLNANRYAHLIRTYNIGHIARMIFDNAANLASRIIFGFPVDSKNILPQTMIVRAKLEAMSIEEGEYFFKLILTVNPRDSIAVENARKNLRSPIINVGELYFKVIESVMDRSKTYNQCEKKIGELVGQMYKCAARYIDVMVGLIHKDKNLGKKFESIFSVKTKKAYHALFIYFGHYRVVLETLAKLAHTNASPSKNDIYAIRAAESKAISLLEDYVEAVSDAFQFALLASHRNWS